MSDRMVSCVRLFAFRKDISMNNKDRKRQIAYEVLMILGSLALLTFICRLWPILLLIILGIFVAAIRLLFLSGNRVDPVEPQPLLPAPIPAPTESDLRKLAHSLITSRITTLVLNEYPNARWIWEAPNAFELIELGEEVYILLNRAGGYRKAKVIIQNLQVIGLQYQEIPKKPDVLSIIPDARSNPEKYSTCRIVLDRRCIRPLRNMPKIIADMSTTRKKRGTAFIVIPMPCGTGIRSAEDGR